MMEAVAVLRSLSGPRLSSRRGGQPAGSSERERRGQNRPIAIPLSKVSAATSGLLFSGGMREGTMNRWGEQLRLGWWMLAATLTLSLVSAGTLAGFSIGRLI
jgi:hypothetical protein